MAVSGEHPSHGAFHILEVIGGLQDRKFVAATSKWSSGKCYTALILSSGEIFLLSIHNEGFNAKAVPWSVEVSLKPAALTFSSNLQWLLIATVGGGICVVPIDIAGPENDSVAEHELELPRNDVTIFHPNGSRAKPTSVLWWHPSVCSTPLAIIGTELGELCFVELLGGKDVGGTYITVPVTELFLCQSDKSVYLLISGSEERQWTLVLEREEENYIYPLENIGLGSENSVDQQQTLATSSTRARLKNLKQLSMDKFMSFKQRLTETKRNAKKKPAMKSTGVGTQDLDEIPEQNPSVNTDQVLQSLPELDENKNPDVKSTLKSTPTSAPQSESNPDSLIEDETKSIISSIPEKLEAFISDIYVTPMWINGEMHLAGICRSSNCLMVHSINLISTPKHVYKLPEGVKHVLLNQAVIYSYLDGETPRISILSTKYSESNQLDGELNKNVQTVLEDVLLPKNQSVLSIFSSPPVAPNAGECSTADETAVESVVGKNTWPEACLIVTENCVYICQTKKSLEELFMDYILCPSTVSFAYRLGSFFSIDKELFERAGDVKIKERSIGPAMEFYERSRVPGDGKISQLRRQLKFAWAGLVPEFITIMNSVGVSGSPDLSVEVRRKIATLSILGHLHLLSLPSGVRSQIQQQTTLRNLLILFKNNIFYDELLTIVFCVHSWRWESLQYLVSNRGLLLEKLHVLLTALNSPVIPPNEVVSLGLKDQKSLSSAFVRREKERGFLHCISDPELRSVLLLNPVYARNHMSFVLQQLDNFDVFVLRRLASLYDPSHPAIKPFIISSSYLYKSSYSTHDTSNSSHSILPPGVEDPIGLEAVCQVFLAVLIKLNHKRGWSYNPLLLNMNPVQSQLREPFYSDSINKKILSCGYSYSAAIVDGQVYSWGLDEYGALGHGPKSTTNPKFLEGFNPTVIKQLEELCSLRNRPVVSDSVLFEPHSAGELKKPPKEDDCCPQPKPVFLLTSMKAFSIACGKNFTLAVTNFGVYGWGNNRYGQIGNGSTGRCPRATLVSSLVNARVVHITCGHYHSLAVTEDGRLYSWGWGVHGQLGHGNPEDCFKPTLVRRLSKKVVTAVAGYAHSAALTSSGTVYAWGCGTYGQLGSGGIAKCSLPVKVQIQWRVTHLASGYFHNVAVTENHKVLIWGCNPSSLRVQGQIQRRKRFEEQTQGHQEPMGHPTSTHQEPMGHATSTHQEPMGHPTLTHQEPMNLASSNLIPGVSEPENTAGYVENEPVPEQPNVSLTSNGLVVADNGISHSINGSLTETQGKEAPESGSTEKPDENIKVSANTVPSCDPSECGHLSPKEVEMPHNFGAVKEIAVGNQHTLLLTTLGTLYTWGKNTCSQLGTGGRKESPKPMQILDNVQVTDIAAGSDFSLALDSYGQIWAWGSNYYYQLSRNSNETNPRGDKVFMLKTTRRILKVPHSVHSNIEVPRPIEGLRVTGVHPSTAALHDTPQKVDLHNFGVLNGVDFESLDRKESEHSKGRDSSEEEDDGLYGISTLHSAVHLLHPFYQAKNIVPTFVTNNAHQALTSLYVLDKEYSRAMHHQLRALLEHTWHEDNDSEVALDNGDPPHTSEDLAEDLVVGDSSSATKVEAPSSRHVAEALKILDHFLRLQIEESQSGMRHVLQEGIGLWLSHALPTPQLEELLLSHLPKTVYPLALLLFGDESVANTQNSTLASSESGAINPSESGGTGTPISSDVGDATAKMLSQLSTKFCLNLCTTVVSHLNAGDYKPEQLDALSQLTQVVPNSTENDVSEDQMPTSPYDNLVDALRANDPTAIHLSPDDVLNLKKGAESNRVGDSGSQEERKQGETDCILFTCGHNFTEKEFKDTTLPQLERTLTTVPGLLGKTARILLDQYHGDQPQMACPHCVLAHLTIKLTKHQAPS